MWLLSCNIDNNHIFYASKNKFRVHKSALVRWLWDVNYKNRNTNSFLFGSKFNRPIVKYKSTVCYVHLRTLYEHTTYANSSGLNNKQLSDILHFWSEISVNKHNAAATVWMNFIAYCLFCCSCCCTIRFIIWILLPVIIQVNSKLNACIVKYSNPLLSLGLTYFIILFPLHTEHAIFSVSNEHFNTLHDWMH